MKTVRFTLRMPESMSETLKIMAAREFRSVNDEILYSIYKESLNFQKIHELPDQSREVFRRLVSETGLDSFDLPLDADPQESEE